MNNAEILEEIEGFLSQYKYFLEQFHEILNLSQLYFIKKCLTNSKPPLQVWFGFRPETADQAALESELTKLFDSLNINRYDNQDIIIKTTAKPEEEAMSLIEPLNETYIGSHGGRIEIMEIDEESGRIILNLRGSCSGCASSIITLKQGIEQLLKQRLPWVRSVEPDQEPQEPDFGFKL